MKKDKNQKYRGQEELLLSPMEKNKTKASEKQPETHYLRILNQVESPPTSHLLNEYVLLTLKTLIICL